MRSNQRPSAGAPGRFAEALAFLAALGLCCLGEGSLADALGGRARRTHQWSLLAIRNRYSDSSDNPGQ
jgi:hypothetical protein